ncbi:MAG TPA: hypothetical protein VE863_13185 [Pyrinomonadaceae bacterium]|jgi:hypothetical protein|nr:hypothetical protein [Pyrinomonadaceae bacterium]
MFQLFDIIMTSPIAGFVFAKAQDVIAALVVSDCDDCGFNDLGKLLFGGLALAILVGVGVSILIWKMKDKEPARTSVVSIHHSGKEMDVK